MKRLMQAMLSVALVLVTAFTFCINTASAQPVSSPAPTSCTTPDCPPSVRCQAPAHGYCDIYTNPYGFQRGVLTLTNKSTAQAVITLAYADNLVPVTINPYPYNVYQRAINSFGGPVRIYNDSSLPCDIDALLIIQRSGVVPEK
jgi:hypothetical protein